MKSSKKLTIAVMALAMVTTSAHAREKAGNGGDFIRFSFMDRGDAILKTLEKESGQKFIKKYGIHIDDLKGTLSTEIIHVADETLKDRDGSVVDAIGEKGSIRLNYSAWKLKVFRGENIDTMVFHEMLRAVEINDDDYVISKKMPPVSKQVQHLPDSPLYNAIRLKFLEADPLTPTQLSSQVEVYHCSLASFSNYLNDSFDTGAWRDSLNVMHVSLHSLGEYLTGSYDLELKTANFLDQDRTVHFGRSIINPESGDRALLFEQVTNNYHSGSDTSAPTSIQNSHMQAAAYYYCELVK